MLTVWPKRECCLAVPVRTMKKEYDFSRGERGKFYRPEARFKLPVYLDEDVRKFVEGIAGKKKRDVSAVVNDLLKSDMRVARTIGQAEAGDRRRF